MIIDHSCKRHYGLPISPLSLDSVIEGVPSVCVGVDVPMLWGGVHVTDRKVEPRPDDVPLEMLLVTLPSVSANAICDTLEGTPRRDLC